MRILIASGGTGGHLYPALVLARKLKGRGCEVLLALRANETAPRGILPEDIPKAVLEGAPLYRSAPLKNVAGAFSNLKGFMKGFGVVRRFRPDAAVGFGGYASVPILLACALQGVPVLVHEQNAVAGLANRICSVFARRVAVSFDETLRDFPEKGVWVGNLVREEFFREDRPSALKALGLTEGKLTVLIFGGSAGARGINRAAWECAGSLKGLSGRLQFIHQTGNADDTLSLKQRYLDMGFAAAVREYFHEMAPCYSAADIVVSRAGAGTVSELMATQRPALLIPYPSAAGDHQARNAETLSKLGAARILTESQDLGKRMEAALREFVSSPEILKKMKEGYRQISRSLRESPGKMADLAVSLAKP
ncbi:MAG: undecaprenyldiphospho-muramoylpentapeptide beta-N-acetylglucosaminyltransferase [Elusimicrobia bacterium RIFCSPLOWO2_01_FULL_60_11]|nr:MAG: undecaprenyldiphospho-muramoylpentapeptide beta-N-acetylglucosaminyltransferase [Elusimicrobia bacterium RIFCSPLOWO2_01_FULL_60_11]